MEEKGFYGFKSHLDKKSGTKNILQIMKESCGSNNNICDFHYVNKNKTEKNYLFSQQYSNTKKNFSLNRLSNSRNKKRLENDDFIFNKEHDFCENIITNLDENIKKENEILFVIIRHGERADLAGSKIKFHLYDPELTEKGIKQAYEAGGRLKEMLDILKPENKKIAIITSPFSRCIMTAKYIKNGMNYNLPLFIENGLSEFINRKWFKSSPKEFLCYFKANTLLFQEINNEIIIDKSIGKLPEFPESTSKCTERFQKIFDSIIDQYANRTGFNVLILVTHYFGIQSFCEKMNIVVDNFSVEYCSTFIFRHNTMTQEFKFENSFYPIDEEIY